MAFHPGPNGDVTYADLLSGNVRRLVYTTGNRPPTARFATTTDAANRTVSLSATDSYDLDGDELTFQWDFGDGTSATGRDGHPHLRRHRGAVRRHPDRDGPARRGGHDHGDGLPGQPHPDAHPRRAGADRRPTR